MCFDRISNVISRLHCQGYPLPGLISNFIPHVVLSYKIKGILTLGETWCWNLSKCTDPAELKLWTAKEVFLTEP